jgi:hypothetical protein
MKSDRAVIKVGFCVSYDWEYLKVSVPKVYNDADIICLSIDINRKSWSGIKYSFDNQAFYQWVKWIDVENKINIYEDDFAIDSLSPLENDNRQRNMIAKYLGEGGWHIQVDADEYFIGFSSFVKYLKKINPYPLANQKPVNICVNLIPILKKLDRGVLIVNFENKPIEYVPFATNIPIYEAARRNGHFNILTNYFVIHDTWARKEEDLWKKINNWGHRDDFNKESYFNLWKALDQNNYQYIHDFHPINPSTWPALRFLKGDTIEEVIKNIGAGKDFQLSYRKLLFANSRNFARLRSLIDFFQKYVFRPHRD